MTAITITGIHKNPDGSFPDGTAVRATLQTPFLVSSGAIVNRYQVSAAIDDDDGTFSLPLQVPDSASQSARYHFKLPDGQAFYTDVNQNSDTAWEDFIAAATA